MNAETAALRAIATAVSDERPIERSPIVDAAMQFTNQIAGIVNECDGLRHETGLQRQRIACLEQEKEQLVAEFEAKFVQYRAHAEAEIARLRAQCEEAADHARFFMEDAQQLREAQDAIERIVERSRGVHNNSSQSRPLHRKAVNEMPAMAEPPFGAPKPQFLSGSPTNGANVTPITRVRPVSI